MNSRHSLCNKIILFWVLDFVLCHNYCVHVYSPGWDMQSIHGNYLITLITEKWPCFNWLDTQSYSQSCTVLCTHQCGLVHDMQIQIHNLFVDSCLYPFKWNISSIESVFIPPEVGVMHHRVAQGWGVTNIWNEGMKPSELWTRDRPATTWHHARVNSAWSATPTSGGIKHSLYY